ncbi:hypothetical protein [Halosolutus halophilus]|uniref:hypothetical protein n=1 Tax=Halosolutus halophilus TaxID=1552990 RepID=UPI0022352A5F|nr:hypothetical protein [Halosolutus halophilus]
MAAVSRARWLATTTDAVGAAYNIGTGSAVTIRELAEAVPEITDTDAEIVHTEPRPGDIEHSEADIANAADHLGYAPTVAFREGLERTAEWVRSS